MSEFKPEEQEQDDNEVFRTELQNAGVKSSTIQRLLQVKKDASQTLYTKEIEAARKIKVSSAGEIPENFKGKDIAGTEAMRRIMFVALLNGILKEPIPFRRLWYKFVKTSLQAVATEFNIASAFYGAMSDMVKSTDLTYKDFNIINVGDKGELMKGAYDVKEERSHLFPNVLIGIEDASYYGVFKNMADLLGLHRYSAGGQSSLSASEVITDQLKQVVEMDENYPLHIRSITDLDPAGYNIANAYLDHFSNYLGNLVTSKRLVPLMKHYTLNELVQNLYMIKLSTMSQQSWEDVLSDLAQYREAFERRMGFDAEDTKRWHKEAQQILKNAGSFYKNGVKKGMGRPPDGSKAWKKFERENPIKAEEIRDEIDNFINKLPNEAINWWQNIVGNEERPSSYSKDPISLFRFIALNEYIYPYGVELASVPENPLDPNKDSMGNYILDPFDPNFRKGSHNRSGKGQARMRLIIFDELVEEFGLQKALENFFRKERPSSENIIDNTYVTEETKEGKQEFYDPIGEIAGADDWSKGLMGRIKSKLNQWWDDYWSVKYNELKEDIDDWIDNVFEQYLDTDSPNYNKEIAEEEKKKIWEKLRNAVLNDQRYVMYYFPESFDETEYGYNEEYTIEIPDSIFNSMQPIKGFLDCIELNLREFYYNTLNNYSVDDLDQDWSEIIPNVRGCRVVDDNLTFFEGDNGDENGNGEFKKLAEERLEEIDELNTKIYKINMKYRELQDTIDKVNKELRECQRKLKGEKEGGKKAGLGETLYYKQFIQSLERERDRLKEKLNKTETELFECSTELGRLKEKSELLKGARGSEVIGAQQRIDEVEEELSNLMKDWEKQNKTITDLQEELSQKEEQIKLLKEQTPTDSKGLEECEREKKRLEKEKKTCETNLNKCRDKLQDTVSKSMELRAQIAGLQRQMKRYGLEKATVTIMGKEVDLEKLIEEHEEKFDWRQKQEREQAEGGIGLPEGFTNPWTHIDWEVVEDGDVEVFEAQADVMEQTIMDDPAPKKKVLTDKIREFRDLINKIKKDPPLVELMSIHSDMNSLVKRIKTMHEKL